MKPHCKPDSTASVRAAQGVGSVPRPSHRLCRAATLAAVLAAAGCTGVAPPRAPAPSADSPWQRDVRVSSLEVPPDLSRSGVRDAYPIPGAGAREDARAPVLPGVEGIRIERDGHLRWLVADAEPADLWPGIRDFWQRQGFALETEDAKVGVIETGWAEKREQLPVGGVRKMLERFKRFAYTYGVRDRFRTRVERSADPGVTEIHVTHRGAHEVVRGDSYAWAPRPSDPALEAEMLGRLMHFLAQGDAPAGAPAPVAAAGGAAAEPGVKVMEAPSGGKYIRLDEGFDRSWRMVRRAVDRGGFTVVDLDRSAGFFLVRYIDPDAPAEAKRSGLGRLAFWRDQNKRELPEDVEFRIVVEGGDGPPTRVVVQDAEGAPDTGGSGGRILAALAENLE